MGGRGSGRRNQVGKDATEDSRPLDIRKLNRRRLLQPGQSFGWQWTICDQPFSDILIEVKIDHVVLAYNYRIHRAGEWEGVRQFIYMDRTHCHLGGGAMLVDMPELRAPRRGAVQSEKALRLPALLAACLHQPTRNGQ